MENNKQQISEGLLTSIIDNFFKSLQKGVAKKYIAAAEKAGMDKRAVEMLAKIHKNWDELDTLLKKDK